MASEKSNKPQGKGPSKGIAGGLFPGMFASRRAEKISRLGVNQNGNPTALKAEAANEKLGGMLRDSYYNESKALDFDKALDLIKSGADPDTNFGGSSALHFAVTSNRPDAVDKLLACGASTTLRARFGWTPVHHAAVCGNTDIMRSLIRSGADVNSTTDAHKAPLHLAATQCDDKMVEALLLHGADPLVKDQIGYLPYHCAKEPQNTRNPVKGAAERTVALLKEAKRKARPSIISKAQAFVAGKVKELRKEQR